MALGIISIIVGVIIVIIGFATGVETVNQQIVQYLKLLIGAVFAIGGLIIITIKKSSEKQEYLLSLIDDKLQPVSRQESQNNQSFIPPTVKNTGSNWVCKECGTENPSASSSCKGCGKYR